jgi:spermidine synthase
MFDVQLFIASVLPSIHLQGECSRKRARQGLLEVYLPRGGKAKMEISNSMTPLSDLRKAPFLSGVFLITFSLLIFQILQTRILSVIAWYYMAFFAISVAMLGMTVGAVWVYLWRERFQLIPLPVTLSNFALLAALAMPASVAVQFCLITSTVLSLTTVISWSLLLIAMAVPYVFSGVVVSLALTRSPFPTGQVYGVDLLGAALGCVAVIAILNVLNGPTAVVVAGVICSLSALAFAASAGAEDRPRLESKPWWKKPAPIVIALVALALFNALSSADLRPILVKDVIERSRLNTYEKWNSYSRIRASRPVMELPPLWGASPKLPPDTRVPVAALSIDGAAGTSMFHYDGTRNSIAFLQYDLVNLAYRLPDIYKSAVIGVGGGRDLLSAHLFGVTDITGVELNPIFINLHTRDPFYKNYSNLTALPSLKLHVDDARSWFAATKEKFDLIQMSMIDTWAATGAGAFSLSENGLYTLEGWRAFLKTLNNNGIFTVSRWYSPGDVNETGRMIGLATAALLDAGVKDVRPHLFVANANNIATLVLSKAPFTEEQLRVLNATVEEGGFAVLLAPDHPPESALLRQVTESQDLVTLNRALNASYLDLTVPTDARPFFFNQLRIFDIPSLVTIVRRKSNGQIKGGVVGGNLTASEVLGMILFLSIIAVIATILVPLKGAARQCPRRLVVAGSLYFSLIGMGFMLAEIALLQYFSVYLGHPIYSLGVCLFSLILASGLGSLTSDRLRLGSRGKLLAWGAIVVAYLVILEWVLPAVFQSTTARERLVRTGISLAVIMPLGFLLGFAFPTGMRLIEAVDRDPTPWFWGINGATGVLASVLGVMLSMSLGINVTMLISAVCYLVLIPTSFTLLGLQQRVAYAAHCAGAQPSQSETLSGV